MADLTELHRSGNSRLLALKGGGIGLGALVIAAVGALIGGPAGGYLAVFCGLIGGFLVLVAVVFFVLSLRPFHISFSTSGLDVNNGDGLRFRVSWGQVDALGIERMATEQERYLFVVWLDPSVPMKERPTFPPGGSRKGYAVAELDDIKESRDELAAIINRYAGTKFRSNAYRS